MRGISDDARYKCTEGPAMDCNHYQKSISILMDGESGAHSSEALEKHLAACPACRNAYEQMLQLNNTLNTFGLYSSPSTLASNVKACLAERNVQHKGRPFSRAWRQVPLFVTLVLLAIGLGNLAGRSISEILADSFSSETRLQYLFTDAGQSFSDIVMDIAAEENSR